MTNYTSDEIRKMAKRIDSSGWHEIGAMLRQGADAIDELAKIKKELEKLEEWMHKDDQFLNALKEKK